MHTPRPHQSEAISACVTGLKRPHSRGQCIMACGTGKTLVGYEIAQGLKAKRVLALVPSLLLVNQLAKEYRKQGATHIMSVCSDENAGGADALHISVKELETDNTQDAAEARAFMDGPGQRIVVCTYQSLRSLSEVFDGLAFDLAIFDEAHKTAGSKSKLFAHALQDNGLKCERRLFMTATPRHAKLVEDGSEYQVFAMNNPKVYGPVLYSLPLRTAIKAGIIDDYRIIVAVVSQHKTDDLKEQAVRIAIDRAMHEYGIRKIFTFHARVADASGFILGATDTLKGARLYHVNGEQSSSERGLKLEGFRNAERALMSNARCLTEGVDLPAADMVAFLVPKKNPIDIVQAVGRVLRKHKSKAKGGFVFLPVFVRDGEDEEAAIAESDWSGCYEVLQAMREQDEPLSAALSKCARGDGELPEQIIVIDGRKRSAEESESDHVQLSEGMRRAIRVKMVSPFRIDPNGKKAELMKLAISGSPRPSIKSDRILATALSTYCLPNSNMYDASFLEAIRKVAPTWFGRTDPIGKKRELLELARAGLPRPICKTQLGQSLSGYTRKTACSFDPAFDLEIRKLAPLWFIQRKNPTMKKRELLSMAHDGSPKPALGEPFGPALNAYTQPSFGSTFDPVFKEQLRAIRPDWFNRTLIKAPEQKRELLRLARSHLPRPLAQSRLGSSLRRFCKKNSMTFDPIFLREIASVAPEWLTFGRQLSRTPGLSVADGMRAKKQALLDMARAGNDRPSASSGHLGHSLFRYTNVNQKGYDKEFHAKLAQVNPSWFKRASYRRGGPGPACQELIELAKSGAPLPANHTRLRDTLHRCRRNFQEVYAELRRLAPHWFRKPKETT